MLADLLSIALALVGLTIVPTVFGRVLVGFVQNYRVGNKSFDELQALFEQDLPAMGVSIFAVDARIFALPRLVVLNLECQLSSIHYRSGRVRFETGMQKGQWVLRPTSRWASPESARFLSFRRKPAKKALKHNFEVLSASENTLPEWSHKDTRVRCKDGVLANGDIA